MLKSSKLIPVVTMVVELVLRWYQKATINISCESAEKVASIDDIMVEILLHLPASSLLGLKSVSKHWLSIISSPSFSRLHSRRPLRPSGLLIPNGKKLPEYRYIPLNSTSEEPEPLSRTITFPSPSGPDGMRILQSCNGLLLCTSSISNLFEYYLYNPTTRQLTTIPFPYVSLKSVELTYDMVLAFDPSRSPHYKLVFPLGLGRNNYRMVVYSSETQVWKVCGDRPFKDRYETIFSIGVYLNGAVHYMSFHPTCIYFHIDEERLETMPMPLIPNNNLPMYFGESGGRLHIITERRESNVALFDVYEMEKDCSKWYVRYQIELREVSFVEIMGIVHGEREEDSFLVFETTVDDFVRLMKYKFADKTMKLLFRTEHRRRSSKHYNTIMGRSLVYEYIQSLSPV